MTSTAAKSSKPKWWRPYALTLGVCAGLSAVGYFFGIQPALAQRAENENNVVELDARRQKSADLNHNLAITRRKLTETNLELANLPLHLEPASSVNNRIALLTDLANATHVTITEMQPSAPSSAPHYQTVPIRIVASGTFPSCATFLHQLREKFADTGIRSFECTNPNPSADTSPALFRVELVWYTAPRSR
jgi:Tfp pilus assembly protein PilO